MEKRQTTPDYDPEFVLIDPRPVSVERYRELAKWHDTFHPIAASNEPLEEEWSRVNDLINALAYTRAALAAAESTAAGLRSRAERAEAQLEPGSPTERYPTVWAYEQVCKVLEESKSTAAGLKQELADQEREKLELVKDNAKWQEAAKNLVLCWTEGGFVGSPAVDFIPQSDQQDALREFKSAIKGLLPVAPACPGNCTTCEKGEPWRAVFATEAEYDASVESAVSRIESGEIQPREPDEDKSAARLAKLMQGVREINGKEKLLRKLTAQGVFTKKDESAAPPVQGKEGGRDV
jgi:hypothetical protein